MSQVAAGTVWNLPNYLGELFTADAINTPILTMIGGMAGGYQVDNFEFSVASTHDYPTAAQPAITETASLTIPTAISFVRAQQKNVAQIYHEHVSLSYAKMSIKGRITGTTSEAMSNPVADEKAWQISQALVHMARDAEFTILQGSYQIATSAAVANKSRGLIECASDASNTVAAGSVALSDDLIKELMRTMFDNGATFMTPVFVVNSFQKQQISEIFGYAPTDRNVGGVNIKQVETDFGLVGVVLNRFQPAATLTIAEMSVLAPVAQPVIGKGNFFYEDLGKEAAYDAGQVYGQLGLDHGPNFMHGTITGLTTS